MPDAGYPAGDGSDRSAGFQEDTKFRNNNSVKANCFYAGEAITLACRKLKKEMEDGKTLAELEGEEYLGEYTCITDPITTDKEHPYSHLAYSYGVQLVSLDEQGRVSEVNAVYDIGQVINKKNAEGQLHGGIVMGLGYALTEDFPLKWLRSKGKDGNAWAV